MSRVAVIGYASLDHVAMLDGAPKAGRTTTILDRPDGAWPRLGGSPSYVAGALVANGVANAFPISWIGADTDGEIYRTQLAARGISDAGIAVISGSRTPAAIMAYLPDGGCACLYDPGLSDAPGLTVPQATLIGAADWLCVTIGPAAATEAALAAMSAGARLCWVVKHDPRAMPPALAERMASRSDLIFCSQAERAFVEEALAGKPLRAGQILIETRGSLGAMLIRDGREWFAAAAGLVLSDPTGAGDSFAGGALAAIVKGEADPVAILQAGHAAAHAVLEPRTTRPME